MSFALSGLRIMMQVILVLALATLATSEKISEHSYATHTAYGYLQNVGIPAAERIYKAEQKILENEGRIIGGVPAGQNQYPYQAGIISDIVGITGRGVCGGALISTTRVLTAAHCWNDGRNQAWRLTVVLGSTFLFSGGTRILTSVVSVHSGWFPLLARNDIAVVFLPNPVATSANIAPIALPTASLVNETFADNQAILAGFGLTRDGGSISEGQYLSHVRLHVISNALCRVGFPLIIQSFHMCTSGVGNVGPCGGDSGGPLVIQRNNVPIAIGITSFVSTAGCESGLPAGYTRITSFLNFINQNL